MKDKRRIVRSVSDRVRNRFNVSIAEVGNNDHRHLLTIGICCVSNNARHANEVLSKVVDYITTLRLDAELVDYQMEILPEA